jgi:cell wall-associated NlpC family hydrolase
LKNHVKKYAALFLCGAMAFLVLAAGTGAPAQAAGVTTNAYAHIANTGGDNINFREGAGSSYNAKDQVTEGTVVWVLEGPIKDDTGVRWFRVDLNGRVGWVNADYLAPGKGDSGASSSASTSSKPATTSSSSKSTASSSSTSASTPSFKAGSYAAVAHTDGDALRVRKTATSDGTVTDTLDPNTVVQVVKGPTKDSSGTNWYQVKSSSSTGWVMARYLTAAAAPKAAAAKPVAKVVAKPTAKPAAAAVARSGQSRGAQPPASSASASSVVQMALRYVGYRYVYAGTTPAGFDCSGFVYYVFNKVGIPLSRAMPVQIASGTPVSSSNLRPGDLVYFRNTYRSGISHISIYIGNGKIVHAADYDTGVEISDLWSAYWAAHYAGAVRITH